MWGQIVAKAWADAAFQKRLLAEAAAVLQEHGIAVPADVQIKVVEDIESVRHLILPAKPAGELSEQALAGVAGGRFTGQIGDVPVKASKDITE